MSGSTIPCTTVTGIDPGSWLQVRTGPGYGYGPIAQAHSRLYSGYVNDRYLNTGSPDVWKQPIRQCPA